MAKMMQMMKQMNQVRKMQKELKKKEVTISSNDKKVTVVAKGDMTIKSIDLNVELTEISKARLEKILISTINGALDAAKKAAATDMQKITESMGGLGGLFGGK